MDVDGLGSSYGGGNVGVDGILGGESGIGDEVALCGCSTCLG